MANSADLDDFLQRCIGLVAQEPIPGQLLLQALRDLESAWPPAPLARHVERSFELIYVALGLDGYRRDYSDDTVSDIAQRMAWAGESLLDKILTRSKSKSRFKWYPIQDSNRMLALRNRIEPETMEWLQSAEEHIPLDFFAAQQLLMPVLDYHEKTIAKDPCAYLSFAWNILEDGNPPFRAVIRDWLASMDERQIPHGPHFEALHRARALYKIAEQGRQVVNQKNLNEVLIPRLRDPHPLVAAHNARFLGSLLAEGQERIHDFSPDLLWQVMTDIVELPRNRRAVAGGFVEGYNGFDVVEPINRLRQDLEHDIEDWILAVLNDGQKHEPYLPGTQAFWFPLHEEYSQDPEMALRFVEAGEDWIAFMCVTEVDPPAPGMDKVLRAIIDKNGELAQPAQRVLENTSQSS